MNIRRLKIIFPVIIVLAALSVLSKSFPNHNPSPNGSQSSPSATQNVTASPVATEGPSSVPSVSIAQPTSARKTVVGQYPNVRLTPGDVFVGVTAKDVCVSGYSSSVRDVPIIVKRQVYEEYGVPYPQPTGSYELDHFIPLELGGSNDIKNLWPEPAEPAPGFHEKDEVENYLHQQVCAGNESLEQAQSEMKTDWVSIYSLTQAEQVRNKTNK